MGDKRSLFTSNYVHSDPSPYCPELLPFSQAQLASLMALSTQGGDVPLRIFAEHQVCLRWSIVFLWFEARKAWDFLGGIQ